MNKIDWSEKSIFRKIIIILSALQVVAFFALPYARMNSAVGSLNSLAILLVQVPEYPIILPDLPL